MLDEGQKSLHFGSEVKGIAHDGVVERLDAETVAGAEETLIRFVPKSESEHAAQMVDTIRTPSLIGSQNNFGVRSGLELLASKFIPEFNVVVDFAVVGD